MKPIEITDENFKQEVLESDIPVLIDFWAVWCGPCKLISPVIDEIAVELQGKVKVGKLDVDNNQNSAITYGVRSIPALKIFKGGKEVENIIGAVPKAQILQKINSIL